MTNKRARFALKWFIPLVVLVASAITAGCGGSDNNSTGGENPIPVNLSVDFPTQQRAVSPFATRVHYKFDAQDQGDTDKEGDINRLNAAGDAETVSVTVNLTPGAYILTMTSFAGNSTNSLGSVTRNVNVNSTNGNTFNFSTDISDDQFVGINVSGTPSSVDNTGNQTVTFTLSGVNSNGATVIADLDASNFTFTSPNGTFNGNVFTPNAGFVGTAVVTATSNTNAALTNTFDVTVTNGPSGGATFTLHWDDATQTRGIPGYAKAVVAKLRDSNNNVVATQTLVRQGTEAYDQTVSFGAVTPGDYTLTLEAFSSTNVQGDAATGNLVASTGSLPFAVVSGNSDPVVVVDTQLNSAVTGYSVNITKATGGTTVLGTSTNTFNATFNASAVGTNNNDYTVAANAVNASGAFLFGINGVGNGGLNPGTNSGIKVSLVSGTSVSVTNAGLLPSGLTAAPGFTTLTPGASVIRLQAQGAVTRDITVNVLAQGNAPTLSLFAMDTAGNVFINTVNNNGGIAGYVDVQAAAEPTLDAIYTGTSGAGLNSGVNTVTEAYYTGNYRTTQATIDNTGTYITFVVHPEVDSNGSGTAGGIGISGNRGDIWTARINLNGAGAITGLNNFQQQTPAGDDMDDEYPAYGPDGKLYVASVQVDLTAAPNNRRNGTFNAGRQRRAYVRNNPTTDAAGTGTLVPTSETQNMHRLFVNSTSLWYVRLPGAETGALNGIPGQLASQPLGGGASTVSPVGFLVNPDNVIWSSASGLPLITRNGNVQAVSDIAAGTTTDIETGATNGLFLTLDDPATVGVVDPRGLYLYLKGGAFNIRFVGNVVETVTGIAGWSRVVVPHP